MQKRCHGSTCHGSTNIFLGDLGVVMPKYVVVWLLWCSCPAPSAGENEGAASIMSLCDGGVSIGCAATRKFDKQVDLAFMCCGNVQHY